MRKLVHKIIISSFILLLIIVNFHSNTPISSGNVQNISDYEVETEAEISNPITIRSNADFHLYDFEGWGTKEQPYIIEGLKIDTDRSHGIRIEGVSDCFIIRNCILSALTFGIYLGGIKSEIVKIENCIANNGKLGYGLFILDSSNLFVNNNDFSNNQYGISILQSHNLDLINNTCDFNSEGIAIYQSTYVMVTNSSLSFNSENGAYVDNSPNTAFVNNRIRKNHYGIYSESDDLIIFQNKIQENYYGGIVLERASNCRVTANYLYRNQDCGIILNGWNDNPSSNNLLYNNIFILNNGSYRGLGYNDMSMYIYNVQAIDNGLNNRWFNSYEKLGNYWHNWDGNSIYVIRGTADNADLFPIQAEDKDNDKLDDILEHNVYFTSSQNNDTDSDGIIDGEEIHYYRTNPNKKDSDQDFLDDYDELFVYFSDPARRDTDTDGLLDGNEIIKFGTNPCCKDSEGDGMSDGWEIVYNLNPLEDDSSDDVDFDFLKNIDEFRAGTNPLIIDTDGDTLSDGLEVLLHKTNPLNPDSDGDNLLDGDEIHIFYTNPSDSDTDDDGLSDFDEIAVFYTKPTKSDTENDGMLDGWEVKYNLDPFTDDSSWDPDKDGLSNLQEFVYKTNPKLADSDGDGFPDSREIMNKHNPMDPLDHPLNPFIQLGISSFGFISFFSLSMILIKNGDYLIDIINSRRIFRNAKKDKTEFEDDLINLRTCVFYDNIEFFR